MVLVSLVNRVCDHRHASVGVMKRWNSGYSNPPSTETTRHRPTKTMTDLGIDTIRIVVAGEVATERKGEMEAF